MTTYCDIITEYAAATSVVVLGPGVVCYDATSSSSYPVTGVVPQGVLRNTALAYGTFVASAFALIREAAIAASTTRCAIDAATPAVSKGKATSTAICGYVMRVTSSATSSSSASSPPPSTVVTERAQASASATVFRRMTMVLTSTGVGSSRAGQGAEDVVYESVLLSSAFNAQRTVTAVVASFGTATSSLGTSASADTDAVSENAEGSSSVVVTLHATNVATDAGFGTSTVLTVFDAMSAFVMNTETGALSRYSNYQFDSIAMVNGVVMGVGPLGLYALEGDTDNGDLISAEVVTGFGDFGDVSAKRVESVYFGYTSEGELRVKAEVLEGGSGTYSMEARPAGAPRNNRTILGKGLRGRYWRWTITNTAGAAFTVVDAFVDVASSNRRV